MWIKIYCSVFVFLFTINDVFATQRAIKSARDHFTTETDTTWIVIAGMIATVGIMAWLINRNKKNADKKKKQYTKSLKERFSR